jgi:hypothetical protein
VDLERALEYYEEMKKKKIEITQTTFYRLADVPQHLLHTFNRFVDLWKGKQFSGVREDIRGNVPIGDTSFYAYCQSNSIQ